MTNRKTSPEDSLRFQELAVLEPGLVALLVEALSWQETAGPGFCANAVFYGYDEAGEGLKTRLSRLVGYDATKPALRNSEAYDVAYDVIYEALPDCRHGDPFC